MPNCLFDWYSASNNMSYQVLARKWRPQNFHQMAGQEHVLKALINALDREQLHHAYLFTGTRGVGKTSIARVLAKCFNCEKGVSSTPCGECNACSQIADGRFIDLIEVDAASRTKVEDTRELLENVQYAPTSGRYKVYLIDEVHMLSAHSFNALLKTLEEPPPHVKFLLATTDPQKLPATILSRCLQFNLKNLSPERIVEHLQKILAEESISFEEPALWHLGRAADGSMRDALSLTDQAIAFGSGTISETDVQSMLGSIDHAHIHDMVKALIQADGKQLLSMVRLFSEYAPDYMAALDALLSVLHRIAVTQTVPEATDNSLGDQAEIEELAQQMPPEDLQLFYQIGLAGKRDLPLVADQKAGFEMILLRMLAFKPEGVLERPESGLSTSGSGQQHSSEKTESPLAPVATDQPGEESVRAKKPEKGVSSRKPGNVDQPAVVANKAGQASKRVIKSSATKGQLAESLPEQFEQLTPAHWIKLFANIPLAGVEKSVASHCVLSECQNGLVTFLLDDRYATLYSKVVDQRLQDSLTEFFGTPVRVAVELGRPGVETPADYRERIKAEQQQQAVDTIRQDPNIKILVEQFAGRLDESSIKPIDKKIH
jgi:DNA polymerase-3 subunit gamma/tau